MDRGPLAERCCTLPVSVSPPALRPPTHQPQTAPPPHTQTHLWVVGPGRHVVSRVVHLFCSADAVGRGRAQAQRLDIRAIGLHTQRVGACHSTPLRVCVCVAAQQGGTSRTHRVEGVSGGVFVCVVVRRAAMLLLATHVEECCHDAHIDAVEHELPAKQGKARQQAGISSGRLQRQWTSSSTTILLLAEDRSALRWLVPQRCRLGRAAPRKGFNIQPKTVTKRLIGQLLADWAGFSCLTADHILQTTNLRDACVLCCSGCWSVRFIAATRTTRLLLACALKGCCWPSLAPALKVVQICILTAALLLVDWGYCWLLVGGAVVVQQEWAAGKYWLNALSSQFVRAQV